MKREEKRHKQEKKKKNIPSFCSVVYVCKTGFGDRKKTVCSEQTLHCAGYMQQTLECVCVCVGVMSIYNRIVRKEVMGLGLALSCSGWRSSLPVGSSSSLRFSAAAL